MGRLFFLTGWLCVVGLAFFAAPVNAAVDASSAAKSIPSPPPVPPVVSPLDFFRQLLAMTPAERQAALGERPPEDKQVILDKIREFEVLTPTQREARLTALQRQLDFRILIKLPETNRLERLSKLSEADRNYLSGRLRQWDEVPPEIRTAVLTNLILLRFLFPDSNFQTRANLTPYQRALLKMAIEKWNQLPERTQFLVKEYFQRFFTLDEKEQARALEPLSEIERAQMQRCLSVFANMPEAQKARCIAGFEKFTSLTPQERQEFLASAERWEKMSSKEREVWRKLVLKYRMPLPPMPPGMSIFPMPPPPPMPTGTGAVHAVTVRYATNGNR